MTANTTRKAMIRAPYLNLTSPPSLINLSSRQKFSSLFNPSSLNSPRKTRQPAPHVCNT